MSPVVTQKPALEDVESMMFSLAGRQRHTIVCVPNIHSGVFLTVARKAQESQKEMKLLLDMYRSAPKEQRDKVQLMAAEKKAKAEVIMSPFCPPFSLAICS